MFNFKKQNGVAIIVALLVVSLATVLAVSLVKHLNYDIRRTENILRLDQANLYNVNAVECCHNHQEQFPDSSPNLPIGKLPFLDHSTHPK